MILYYISFSNIHNLNFLILRILLKHETKILSFKENVGIKYGFICNNTHYAGSH